jgi:hypothetical protein
VAEAAGFGFRLLVKADNNSTYPKLRGNEDYGPMYKLLSNHGTDLVKALQLAPEKELAWTGVLETFIKLDKRMKRDGCNTDAEKEECKRLGSQLILRFLEAGGQRSELSNYLLLLFFIGDFQPSRSNVGYLRLGHCLNCPQDWNPLVRFANLKAADDEAIENGHRVMKQDNTHNGGGVFVQHPDTCPGDKVGKDRLALELRMEISLVRQVERVEQVVQLAGRTHSAPYRLRTVDFEDEQRSVLYVLNHFHDNRDLRFETKARLEATGRLEGYLALRAECAEAAGLTVGQVESWLSSKACGGKHYVPHPNMLLPQSVCLVKGNNTLEDYFEFGKPKLKSLHVGTIGGRGGQQQQRQRQREQVEQQQSQQRSNKRTKNNPRQR